MRRGFSLMEISIILLLIGGLVSFALSSKQTLTAGSECYASTKLQLQAIHTAVDAFARKNNRLPLPAVRNIGIDNPTYGREVIAGASNTIDVITLPASAGMVSFGALPFQALGLAPSFAGDCWGNKFSYAVTTALTATNAMNDASVQANIPVKTALAQTAPLSTTAYAIISHGEDGLGAVKLNYSGNATGWCQGNALKHVNCQPGLATIMDATFNNGKGAADYFDDMVSLGGKLQILGHACSLAGTPVASGASITAYNAAGASLDRTCTSGVLNGDDTYNLAANPTSPPAPRVDGVCSYSCYTYGCWSTDSVCSNGGGCSAGALIDYAESMMDMSWKCKGSGVVGLTVTCSTGKVMQACALPPS